MKHLNVKIKATVSVLDLSETGAPHVVKTDLFPNLFFNGNFYPSRVMRCARIIEANEVGEAEIWMADNAEQPSGLKHGDKFELRAGPQYLLANCVARDVVNEWHD